MPLPIVPNPVREIFYRLIERDSEVRLRTTTTAMVVWSDKGIVLGRRSFAQAVPFRQPPVGADLELTVKIRQFGRRPVYGAVNADNEILYRMSCGVANLAPGETFTLHFKSTTPLVDIPDNEEIDP